MWELIDILTIKCDFQESLRISNALYQGRIHHFLKGLLSDFQFTKQVLGMSRAAERGAGGSKLPRVPNSKGAPKLEGFSMGWF